MKLTSPQTIRDIMSRSGMQFNKNLGQNFLIDEGVLEDIINASGIDGTFGVLEIGPGLGTLTARLAQTAGKVVAIELDRSIAGYLKDAFIAYANVTILQQDALKADLAGIIDAQFPNMPVAVVANLPYYITSPMIMRLLEEGLPLQSVTVMIQKEVAERIVAKAGTKAYGALSVAAQYHSAPQLIRLVPPECFMPPPKVVSAVIHLQIAGHQKPFVTDEEKLFRVVKAAFGQRRKTLINALTAGLGMPKEVVKELVIQCTGKETVRGEELNLEKFINICEKIH